MTGSVLSEKERRAAEEGIKVAEIEISIEERVRLHGWAYLSEWDRDVIFQIRIKMLMMDTRNLVRVWA